jgi:uncharacterized protein (TIGR03435 family)
MADLAENLVRMANAYIDRRDALGLQGGWDFGISWTPRAMLQAAQTPATDPGGISVFEAVEKELGLRLTKKTIPLMVVDRVDEKPTK